MNHLDDRVEGKSPSTLLFSQQAAIGVNTVLSRTALRLLPVGALTRRASGQPKVAQSWIAAYSGGFLVTPSHSFGFVQVLRLSYPSNVTPRRPIKERRGPCSFEL
jgi:hypothetical protein